MRVNVLFAIAYAVASTGCETGASQTQITDTAEWISFETSPGPFCGKCYSMKITVAYTGWVLIEEGQWAGDYKDWRETRREVKVTSSALDKFKQHLNSIRPAGELNLREWSDCESYWTDNSEVNIVWHDARGHARLAYNFGCDREKRRALAEAITTAPSLLEIADLQVSKLGW